MMFQSIFILLENSLHNFPVFVDSEDREIMKTIFKQNENALKHHYTLTDPIWTELGDQLNRPPCIIFLHWEGFIQPRILQFENKMENEDIRPVLIDYFVAKGIRFRSEINWGELVKDKRFKGTTPLFLQRKVGQMVSVVKNSNPGIEGDDITIEALSQYLVEGAKKPYNIENRARRLIEDYVNIKNSM